MSCCCVRERQLSFVCVFCYVNDDRNNCRTPMMMKIMMTRRFSLTWVRETKDTIVTVLDEVVKPRKTKSNLTPTREKYEMFLLSFLCLSPVTGCRKTSEHRKCHWYHEIISWCDYQYTPLHVTCVKYSVHLFIPVSVLLVFDITGKR